MVTIRLERKKEDNVFDTSKTFPIINLYFRKSGNETPNLNFQREFDNRSKVLYSDGSLRDEYQMDLIKRIGFISQEDSISELHTNAFFDQNGDVYLGDQKISEAIFEGFAEYFITQVKNPVFTLRGLYRNNGIDALPHFYDSLDLKKEKLEVMKQVSFQEREKNPTLNSILDGADIYSQLAILEKNYENNVMKYATNSKL